MSQEIIDLAARHRMAFVNLSKWPKIPEETLELVSIEQAHRHRMIPINHHDGIVCVAISDPTDEENIEAINNILAPNKIIFFIADDNDMTAALRKRYSEKRMVPGV